MRNEFHKWGCDIELQGKFNGGPVAQNGGTRPTAGSRGIERSSSDDDKPSGQMWKSRESVRDGSALVEEDAIRLGETENRRHRSFAH